MKTITKILVLLAVLVVFAGCNLFQSTVTITVNYTGVDQSNTDEDIYLAVAKGSYSFSPTKPSSSDIIDQFEIAHSEEMQTYTFTVPARENYTVFIYFDSNNNQAYDSDERVNSNISGLITYIEEDVTVNITYYF